MHFLLTFIYGGLWAVGIHFCHGNQDRLHLSESAAVKVADGIIKTLWELDLYTVLYHGIVYCIYY